MLRESSSPAWRVYVRMGLAGERKHKEDESIVEKSRQAPLYFDIISIPGEIPDTQLTLVWSILGLFMANFNSNIHPAR